MSTSCKVFSQGLNLRLHNLVKALDNPEIQTVEALLNKFVGNLNAGMMLRRLIYWFPRAKKFGNWVYKSWRNFNAETGLSQGQIKRVLSNKYLEAIGMERELKKANGAPTNHYRLNPEKFIASLAEFLGETVERVKSLMEQAPVSEKTKPTNKRYTPKSESYTSRNNPFAGLKWSDFAEQPETSQSIESEQPNPNDKSKPIHSPKTTQSLTTFHQQTKTNSLETTNRAKHFSFLDKSDKNDVNQRK